MKKAFFVLAILAGMVWQSGAQKKGDFWVGGGLLFVTQNQDEYFENNGYSINPELGYAFSDRWAAGIGAGISHSLITQDGRERRENSFAIAPFARYTCLNWKAVSVFVDGGFAFENSKRVEKSVYSNGEGITYDLNSNSYGIFVNPGFSLRLSKCISLTGHLNLFRAEYQMQESGDSNSNSDTGTTLFSTNLNSPFSLNNFTVGFTVNF